MIINIVCSEANSGWIYSQFIDEFRARSKHKIVVNAKSGFSIAHYTPYYELPKKVFHPCTAWMSHQELKQPLKDKFVFAAKEVDVAISQSKKYADLLRASGVNSVVQIMPGVDGGLFSLRPTQRPTNSNFVAGFVGRSYSSSSRKSSGLLNTISKLSFVDFKETGGKLRYEQVPFMIKGLDAVLSPSSVEGGPMVIIQALSCGVPIICFEGVGMANEFSTGIIKVPFADSAKYLARLKEFWETGEYLKYRDPTVMQAMRDQVKEYTWANFVEKHDAVWESLVKA